jgi:hypothetical protein
MAEVRKGVARIQLPGKPVEASAERPRREAPPESQPDPADPRGVHMLMSKAVPAKKDSFVVPLVGLVLAFSAISLIIQLLIAFS